jgi:hypothetical protein
MGKHPGSTATIHERTVQAGANAFLVSDLLGHKRLAMAASERPIRCARSQTK